jgi:hypothetical protein
MGPKGGTQPEAFKGRGVQVGTHGSEFARDAHKFVAYVGKLSVTGSTRLALDQHVEPVQILHRAVVDFLGEALSFFFSSFCEITPRLGERFPSASLP